MAKGYVAKFHAAPLILTEKKTENMQMQQKEPWWGDRCTRGRYTKAKRNHLLAQLVISPGRREDASMDLLPIRFPEDRSKSLSIQRGTSEETLVVSSPLTVLKDVVGLPLTHKVEILSGVSLVSSMEVWVRNPNIHPDREQNQQQTALLRLHPE